MFGLATGEDLSASTLGFGTGWDFSASTLGFATGEGTQCMADSFFGRF